MYSSAAHACCGLWLQIVVLAALKMRVLPKFNGCSMRHGARILASKWREGVTPNGCRPFGEVCSFREPPEPPWYFAAHALLIDESSRSARCRLTFLVSDRSSLGWDCSSTGLETCLRQWQTSVTCWPNLRIDHWVRELAAWAQRSPGHIPPKRHRLTLTLFLSETRTVLIGSSWWRVSPPPTLKDGHRQWPSGIEARLPALSPESPVSLGASFISLAIGGKLGGR